MDGASVREGRTLAETARAIVHPSVNLVFVPADRAGFGKQNSPGESTDLFPSPDGCIADRNPLPERRFSDDFARHRRRLLPCCNDTARMAMRGFIGNWAMPRRAGQ